MTTTTLAKSSVALLIDRWEMSVQLSRTAAELEHVLNQPEPPPAGAVEHLCRVARQQLDTIEEITAEIGKT